MKDTLDPQQPTEDVPQYDESVIGTAIKWSMIGLVLLLIAGGAAFYLLKSSKKTAVLQKTELAAPVQPARPAALMPTVHFTDITKQAGINFVHNNGAYGDKLLPETMGGGVAFLDFDNDGDQDLLLVNSTSWPWRTDAPKTTSALYENDGKGSFKDITQGSGLDEAFYGMGAAIGDYNNDNLQDVLLTGVGGVRLFHNLGKGKFRNATEISGVKGPETDWSTSASFLDYDNDGKLDLFICNYVKWSREIDFEVGYKLVGVGRAYGQPMNFEGVFSRLLHNEGNGKFKDVSKEAGIQVANPVTGVPAGKSLGVAPVDLDSDGWIDIVVANDTVQNFVFHNQKNGTFKEIGALTGIAFDSYGQTRGAMGIDAGRFRDDGALGITIGNFANEMTALYVAQRSPLIFADEAIVEGIGPASRLLLKFGIFFFDYDLDSRLDILTANGHLEEDISKIQQSQSYRQPAQLFWNCGPQKSGCYVPVPLSHAGSDLFTPIVGRGSAYADIDGDADLDVIHTQTGGAPLLLRNDQQTEHNYVRLALEGTRNNKSAIGAWIKATASGQTIWRQVMPTRSYLSQSELTVTIGLGKASLEKLGIIWPGGKVQEVPTPAPRASLKVTES